MTDTKTRRPRGRPAGWSRLQAQMKPKPAGTPYTPPDLSHAPAQEFGGQHIAAAMAAWEARAAWEDERKKLEALVLSKQARIVALQAEIRDIEAQIGKQTT